MGGIEVLCFVIIYKYIKETLPGTCQKITQKTLEKPAAKVERLWGKNGHHQLHRQKWYHLRDFSYLILFFPISVPIYPVSHCILRGKGMWGLCSLYYSYSAAPYLFLKIALLQTKMKSRCISEVLFRCYLEQNSQGEVCSKNWEQSQNVTVHERQLELLIQHRWGSIPGCPMGLSSCIHVVALNC